MVLFVSSRRARSTASRPPSGRSRATRGASGGCAPAPRPVPRELARRPQCRPVVTWPRRSRRGHLGVSGGPGDPGKLDVAHQGRNIRMVGVIILGGPGAEGLHLLEQHRPPRVARRQLVHLPGAVPLHDRERELYWSFALKPVTELGGCPRLVQALILMTKTAIPAAARHGAPDDLREIPDYV